jgi:hypothetical protein
MPVMKRIAISTVLGVVLAASLSSTALSGPITKQNGSAPAFASFTSICSVHPYETYGLCGGVPASFANVKGKINAVQAKTNVWNLGLSFEHLQPGASYMLWGNRTSGTVSSTDISGFFRIGTVVAGLDGTAKYSYQTMSPVDLAFDLNVLEHASDQYGWTIVTSYWSNQKLQVLNSDGTLFAS